MQKGCCVVRQKDGVMAMRYIDKKDIILMATAHSFKPKKTLGNENEAQEIIQKPEGVMEYNKYMKGVDQVDQYLAFYSFNRKTVKWWKRATTMIHMARVQALIIYKKAHHEPRGLNALSHQLSSG